MITPKGLEYGEMSHVIVIWSKYWSICQNLKDKGKKKTNNNQKSQHISAETNQHGNSNSIFEQFFPTQLKTIWLEKWTTSILVWKA